MRTMTKKEWEAIRLQKNIALIKEINPGKNTFSDITPFLFTVRRYERQLQRLAELSCNGYPMPKIEYRDGKMYSYDVEDVALRNRCEKREARIEKAVSDYATQFNLTVDFQGDPRGLMFTLKTSNGQNIEVA